MQSSCTLEAFNISPVAPLVHSHTFHHRFVQARNKCPVARQRIKDRFVRCKANHRLSFVTDSRTSCSLEKDVSRNFCRFKYPPICKSSGDPACELHEKAGFFFPACLQLHLTQLSCTSGFFLYHNPSLFYAPSVLRRYAKHCIL